LNQRTQQGNETDSLAVAVITFTPD